MSDLGSMNDTSLTVVDVARAIIVCHDRHNFVIENLDKIRLQKSLFFAQSIALYYFNTSLFEEDFEAWSRGPVVTTVHGLTKYDKATLLDLSNRKRSDFVEEIVKIVFAITEEYKDSDELSEITHLPGGAWAEVYDLNKDSPVIHKQLIKERFVNLTPFYKKVTDYFSQKKDYDVNNIEVCIKDLSFMDGL